MSCATPERTGNLRGPFCVESHGPIFMRIMPPVPSQGVGGTGGIGRAAGVRSLPRAPCVVFRG